MSDAMNGLYCNVKDLEEVEKMGRKSMYFALLTNIIRYK